MALNADETELLKVANAALPDWATDAERQQEDLGGFAKAIGAGRAQAKEWLKTQAFIGTALGAAGGAPDWLDQHARDRGTRRRAGESNDALRARLRNISDAVTRPSLLAAVQAMMDDEGISGAPSMVEMPRDGAFFGTWGTDAGTGGTFVVTGIGSVVEFTPTVPFAYPPYQQSATPSGIPLAVTAKSGRVKSHKITIASAAHAGNDGTFVVVGLHGNAVRYVNASGFAGADGAATWATKRLDVLGNVLEGKPFAFWDGTGDDNGFADRLLPGKRGPGFVMMVPFGATEAFAESVREMLRQKKAAGVRVAIERRLIP